MQKAVTVTEAARRLGVSRSKVWSLLREGVLEAERNPLDKRQKLIPMASLQKLQDYAEPDVSEGRPTDALRSVGSGSNSQVRSDELETYLREHWRPV